MKFLGGLIIAVVVSGLVGSPVWGFSGRPGDLSRLEYYSDYFSFTGQDSQGFVAFAMDNNRGRDGDSYQAEHFLKFYDAHIRLADHRDS